MSFQDFSDLASLAEFHSWRGSSGPVLFSSNHRDNNPLCEPPEHSQKRTCWSKGAVEALVKNTFLKKIKCASNNYSWIGGKPAECLTCHTSPGGGACRMAPRLIRNRRLLCSNYSMINKSSTWIIIFIILPSMLLLQPQCNFIFMFRGRRVSKNGTEQKNRKKGRNRKKEDSKGCLQTGDWNRSLCGISAWPRTLFPLLLLSRTDVGLGMKSPRTDGTTLTTGFTLGARQSHVLINGNTVWLKH